MKRILLLLLFALVAVCCSKPAPPVSTSIAHDEYEVYSGWLASHFATVKPMPDVLIRRRTLAGKDLLPQDSLKPSLFEPCVNSERLMGPLLALGNSEFELDQTPAIAVPFDYRFVDKRPTDAVNPFQMVSFSRVAFNQSHSEGVFAVFSSGCWFRKVDSQRELECGGGGGGFLQAYRTEQHVWHFEPVKNCPVTVD